MEVKQDTGEIVYKYIDLYRSFLNEMIKKEFVVSQRNKLNSKIASYFLKMGNYRLAADYYCRANNKHKVKPTKESKQQQQQQQQQQHHNTQTTKATITTNETTQQ